VGDAVAAPGIIAVAGATPSRSVCCTHSPRMWMAWRISAGVASSRSG
jgi:hypothetical protein